MTTTFDLGHRTITQSNLLSIAPSVIGYRRQQTRLTAREKQLKEIFEKSQSVGEEQETIDCPRCGFQMKHMQACHMVCTNCGGHMDCSEKGLTW